MTNAADQIAILDAMRDPAVKADPYPFYRSLSSAVR